MGRPIKRHVCGKCGERRSAKSFIGHGSTCIHCIRGTQSMQGEHPNITPEERAKINAQRIRDRVDREIRLHALARKYKTVWDMKQALKRKGVMKKDESQRGDVDRAGYSLCVRRHQNPRFPTHHTSGYRRGGGFQHPRVSED